MIKFQNFSCITSFSKDIQYSDLSHFMYFIDLTFMNTTRTETKPGHIHNPDKYTTWTNTQPGQIHNLDTDTTKTQTGHRRNPDTD